MEDDTAYRIAQAIRDVENGEYQATAAAKWSIPRTTLRRRLHGGITRSEAAEPYQRLTKEQEEYIVCWIETEELAGRAPSKSAVREFASLMLREQGDEELIGIHWVEGFLLRNPSIIMKVGRPLEASRAKEVTQEAIDQFHERLRHVIAEFNIQPQHITNMDETGVQEGESLTGKVLGSRLVKHTEIKKSEATTWVTILEAITATGRRLTPAVVFTGNTLQG